MPARRHGRRVIPILCQIQPRRVLLIDQEELFGPRPSLELLFTVNRILDQYKFFVIDKARNAVFRGKSAEGSILVLPDPVVKV